MEIAKDQNADAMLHIRTKDDAIRGGGAPSLQLEDPACGVQRPGPHQESGHRGLGHQEPPLKLKVQHRDPQQPPPDQGGGRHARDCCEDAPRPKKIGVR